MSKLHVVFILLFGVFSFNIFAQSYPIPNLVGQYPLRGKVIDERFYWKRFDVQPWDISLKGNHGEVITNTDEAGNRAFELISFKGQNYAKAKAKGKIQLNKDPFESYLDDFTIAFWTENGATGTILKTSLTRIEITPKSELIIHFRNTSHKKKLITLFDSDIPDDGWHNFAIIYSKSSKKLTIYLNGTEKKVFALDDLLTKRYDYKNAALMPLSDFKGGLANVSFARASYDTNQLAALNNIMSDDEQYAIRRFRYYPLDAPNLKKETISQKNGFHIEEVTPTSNRNNESNKAASFKDTGSITLPYLFGENPVTDDYDETRGVTISLWVKIETPLSTPYEEVLIPIVDPLKDTFYSVLYGIDDEFNAISPIFGIQRVRDRIGINTYIERSDKTKFPYYNWFYDPVSFRNKTGWFHIIYVKSQYSTKTYVVKNNEHVNCVCDSGDWDCWRKCQMHYDYTSFLPIDDIQEWGLGSWGISSNAHSVIDDLSIYRWPMDVEQVTALHNYEMKFLSTSSRNLLARLEFDIDNHESSGLEDTSENIDAKHQAIGVPAFDSVIKAQGSHALRIDAPNNYIELATDTNNRLLTENIKQRTIAFWFRVDSLDETAVLYEEGGNDKGIILRLDGRNNWNGDQRNIRYSVKSANNKQDIWTSPRCLEDQTWYHLTAVYDNGEMFLYYNGHKVGEKTSSLSVRSIDGGRAGIGFGSNLGFSIFGHSSNSSFKGYLDDLQIYATALPQAEIQQIVQSGTHVTDTSNPCSEVYSARTKNTEITEAEIYIYPNPNRGYANLEFQTKSGGQIHIKLFNIFGEILYSKEHQASAGMNSVTLNIGTQSTGVYFIKGTGADISFSEKIVVE